MKTLHIRNLVKELTAAISIAAVVLFPFGTYAAAQTYTKDTTLTVKGVAVKIMAGSEADSFAQTVDGFRVTVGANEVFIVRTSVEAPMALENDAGLASCNVLQTRENQLTINGPRTVSVTISGTQCSTTNYAINNTTSVVMGQPNGGETLTAGGQYTIFWQVTGGSPASLRLRLSTDGGVMYPTTIATNVINTGYYAWTVPTVVTTTHARLKLEAWDQGLITATDLSDADFTINGTTPAPPPPPAPPASPTPTVATYDPAAETGAATSIDANQSFIATVPAYGVETCVSGVLVKGATNAAVYYCGRDHKRHPFPNQRIYDSWYLNFAGVVTLSDAQLAANPLGANVTYRPGVRLLKIQTDPKTYAVGKGGVLRWVPDEWTAKKLYGADWNKKIDDVPDTFFTNYTIGDPLPPQ